MAGTLAIRHLFMPLSKPVSVDEAALLIERAFPEMDNRLINATRLGRDVNTRTPAMVLNMIQEEAGRESSRRSICAARCRCGRSGRWPVAIARQRGAASCLLRMRSRCRITSPTR